MNALDTLKQHGIEPLDMHKTASGLTDPETINSIPRQIEALRAGMYLHYGIEVIDNQILAEDLDLRKWEQAKNGRWDRFNKLDADRGTVIKQFYMTARIAFAHVHDGNTDKAIPAQDPAKVAAIIETGEMSKDKPEPMPKAAPKPKPKRGCFLKFWK